jgi:ADP-ribose pyrophosphatase YjhB (NUDIX family)
MYRQHSHCSFCGSPFHDSQRWPRVCSSCGSTTYRNPLPVTIVLLPVDDGLMLIRRGAAPRQGQLALPGGFIELNETWQQAAARELFEEAGVRVSSEQIEDFGVRSTHDGYLLVFGLGPQLREVDLPPFVPNKEAGARTLITAPTELAFPLHTEAVARFFARRSQWRTLT